MRLIVHMNLNQGIGEAKRHRKCRFKWPFIFTMIKIDQQKIFLYERPAAESIRVYCLVLRYRRSADMKPFIKFVPFTVSKDTETQTTDIYIPLFTSVVSSEAQFAEGVDVLEIAKRELINLYKTKVIPEDM